MTTLVRIDLGDLKDMRPRVAVPDYLDVESDDPGERFYDAWRRAWLAQVGQAFEESIGYDPTEFDPEGSFGFTFTVQDAGQLVYVHAEATAPIGAVSEFAGDQPGRLRVAWGLGGDEVLELVLSGIVGLVNVGLTVTGLVAVLKDGRDALDRKLFGRERRLFEDWRDTGVTTMELRQAVFARRDWEIGPFCRVFGCSEDAASDLFKALGYEARRDEFGHRTWHDPSE